MAGLILSTPCAAQIAVSLGIDSDYRLRGYSLTDDHPAFTGQLSYDDPSGAYFSLSGLAELGESSKFLGVVANAGFAKRLGRDFSIDAGVLRSQIRAAAPDAEGFTYSEIYGGAYVGPVAGRIYYSPDYRTSGQSTLYGELEAGFEPVPKWRLSGHLGLLVYLTTSGYEPAHGAEADWRLSIARQFGKFEVHAALSRGGRDSYEEYQSRRTTAVTVGSSLNF